MHRFGLILVSLLLATPALGGTATYTLPNIVTASPLPAGQIGAAYSKTLQATGGVGSYTWTKASGSLPGGVSLGSGGVVSGTPGANGTFVFHAQVADATTIGSIPGPTLLDAAGQLNPGSGWTDPKTSFSYRLSGTAVGKDNHNLPGGDPTGTLDPNLASIGYFQMPATGTITIDGSFNPPITSAAWGSQAAVVVMGLVNQPWIQHASSDQGDYIDGYTSRILATPHANVAAGASYLLLECPNGGPSILTTMEDHEYGGQTATDSRLVGSITSFSIQFEAGRDKDGNAVAVGGRMRYALDGGPYGPWDNNTHDFVAQPTAIELCANTFGTTLSTTFGDVTVRSSKEFSLTVGSNLAIDNVSPLPEGTRSSAYTTTLTASGGTPAYSFALAGDSGPLPAGLTLASDGTLSGTPTGTGTRHIKVQVTDAIPSTATKEFDLTINPQPSITTASPLPQGQVDLAYAQQLTASGGTLPRLFSPNETFPPPAGLSVSATGLVSGTPTVDGSSSFNVHVTDSYGSTTDKTFAITIRRAPSITTATLPPATRTGAYDRTIAAGGGLAPYTFTIVNGSGALPNGLTLESNGQLHGTPSEDGGFGFTVRVADNAGGVASRALTLLVNPAPAFTTVSPLPGATRNACYTTTVAASGGPAALTYALDSRAARRHEPRDFRPAPRRPDHHGTELVHPRD
jgi:hypothetical protein